MNKFISALLVLAIVAITISSCKKKGTDNNNNTTKNDVVITITQEGVKTLTDSVPALPFPFPIEWREVLDSQLNTILAAQGVKKEQIKHAYAKSMTIDMVGSAQTFNFIDDSVKIFVGKNAVPSDSVLIASKHGIPLNATSINFDVITSDVKDFFLSDLRLMILQFIPKANESIAAGTQVHYKMVFDVTYTP